MILASSRSEQFSTEYTISLIDSLRRVTSERDALAAQLNETTKELDNLRDRSFAQAVTIERLRNERNEACAEHGKTRIAYNELAIAHTEQIEECERLKERAAERDGLAEAAFAAQNRADKLEAERDVLAEQVEQLKSERAIYKRAWDASEDSFDAVNESYIACRAELDKLKAETAPLLQLRQAAGEFLRAAEGARECMDLPF